MAKSSQVNPVERHVEKIVLAACMLLLVWVVFYRILATPRRLELIKGPGQSPVSVPPDQADATLLQAAREIEDRMNKEPADVQPVAPYIDLNKAHQETPGLKGPAAMADLSSPRKQRIEKGVEAPPPVPVGLEELAQTLPRPDKPQVVTVRVLPNREPAADLGVAHVQAVFPWEQLRRGPKSWCEILRKTPFSPIRLVVLEVIGEMQEMKSDGSWGPAQPVAPIRRPPVVEKGARDVPTVMPTLPTYDGSNAQAVNDALAATEANWQGYLLQPEFWEIWSSSVQSWVDWKVNLPRTPLSDLVQEGADATDASGAPAPPADPAGQPQVPGAPAVTPVPSIQVQKEHGQVLTWFHSPALETSKVYRFRVRLVLANPLLAQDSPDTREYYKDIAEAKVASITSPPSDWSDPVSVPNETEFFLTGGSPLQGKAKVTVFAMSLGQRVKHDFTIGAGQSIGGPMAAEVTNPLTGARTRRTVEFDSGAVSVEFDFGRKISRAGIAKQTVEMLYLDDRGGLANRLLVLDLDKDSPHRKRYEALLEEVSRAAGTPPKPVKK